MNTFCTIITSSYFPYAVTLYKSLIKINPAETLKVLVCDEGAIDLNPSGFTGIQVFRIKEIYNYGSTDILYNKYATGNMDALRWSMKPVFVSFLLEKGYEKVLFSDCDIFFFTEYQFLYKALNDIGVMLTLHRTTPYPAVNEEEFLSFFKFGMFNAGFFGATRKGLPALKWWTMACAYKIEVLYASGLYNDQKYLDALPVLFNDVTILNHPGCNIAFWNQHECKRVIKNEVLTINDTFPVIFIHFTNKYIGELLNGNDPLIFPYFKEYEKCFKETGCTFNQFISELPEYKEPGHLLIIKRRLLLRTRIKKWLFRLSQSI